MSAPGSFKDVYLDEMKDLWSANDQMTRAVQQLSEQASAPKLKEPFTRTKCTAPKT
ncbi:MAG: DUF892 family protein [Methylorubrum populi]